MKSDRQVDAMETIQWIRGADLEQAEALWRLAFPEDEDGLVRHYFHEREDMVEAAGLYEGGTLTAMAHLNRYQVFFRGLLYDVRYVVGVATHPAWRRQGRMSRLMVHSLRSLRESGEVFALLMPVDSAYYTPFGFRFIQDVEQFSFAPSGEMLGERLPEARPVGPAGCMPVHHRAMRGHLLHGNRGLRSFEVLEKELAAEGGRLAGIREGYLAVYEDEESFQVREAACLETETLKDMLAYAAKEAGGRRILWQMPAGSPLKHLVPCRAGNTITRQPFLMARILDAGALFEDMAPFMGSCAIHVSDSLIPENNGLYRIAESGVVHEKTASAEEADAVMDVGTLAQWLFGYERLEVLAELHAGVAIVNETALPELYGGTCYFNEFV